MVFGEIRQSIGDVRRRFLGQIPGLLQGELSTPFLAAEPSTGGSSNRLRQILRGAAVRGLRCHQGGSQSTFTHLIQAGDRSAQRIAQRPAQQIRRVLWGGVGQQGVDGGFLQRPVAGCEGSLQPRRRVG